MIDATAFARTTLALLQDDSRRYRNFGVYWFFVKALLKRLYDRNNLALLGDYEDAEVIALMPQTSALDALSEAMVTYNANAQTQMLSHEHVAPAGQAFTLWDEDAES